MARTDAQLDAHIPNFTTWHNPTGTDQIVVIELPDGGRQKYVAKAGGDVMIPSMYDLIVQIVKCDDPRCENEPRNPHIKGGIGSRDKWCKHPTEHAITVLGGRAPMLVRKGMSVSDIGGRDLIDPNMIEKRRLEADLANAALAREIAEETMVISEHKKQKLAARRQAPPSSEG